MRPVEQTIIGSNGADNSFSACVASMLELPITAIPNLVMMSNWEEHLAVMVSHHGMRIAHLLPGRGWRAWTADGDFAIAELSDGHHVIVEMTTNKVIWDPHPESKLKEVSSWKSLILLFSFANRRVNVLADGQLQGQLPCGHDVEMIDSNENAIGRETYCMICRG